MTTKIRISHEGGPYVLVVEAADINVALEQLEQAKLEKLAEQPIEIVVEASA